MCESVFEWVSSGGSRELGSWVCWMGFQVLDPDLEGQIQGVFIGIED